MYCIYVPLDKKDHYFKYCYLLEKNNAPLYYDCCCTASESAPLQFLAPYRLRYGEYFVIVVKLLLYL